MILLDNNSIGYVTRIAERICDGHASKEETDEFMQLMYDTESIHPNVYLKYKDASDIGGMVDIALTVLLGALVRFEGGSAEQEDHIKPAA